MATTNPYINQSALATKIQGLRELKAAFQALPERARAHLNDATELTLMEAVRHAKAFLASSPSIRTRALYNAVNWTLNRNNGRGRFGIANVTTTMSVGGRRIRVKGIIKAGKGGSALTSQGAKKLNPTRYAHFVEFGTRHFPAEPFIIPAGESQEKPYLDRCRAAGKATEKDLAAIGMRYQ